MRQEGITLKTDEIKLFYNDIKYVTRSLKKDCELLSSLLTTEWKKSGKKESLGFENFMRDGEKRLEELREDFIRLKNLSKKGNRNFYLPEWNSLKELDALLVNYDDITEELRPSDTWMSRANYDLIHEMLDEVQTKTEDSIKSKNRIFKVWSDEVLQPYNVRFTIEYVDMLNETMKYFNTNFWKYKRHLKKLFIEDEELYSDEEIKLLKKNVSTMTENDNWLYFKKRHIQEVLGERYCGKETDFQEIRRCYDVFYSWLLKQPDEKEITRKYFLMFCEHLITLRRIDGVALIESAQELLPFMKKEFLYTMDIQAILNQIDEYRLARETVELSYGFSCHKEMKEFFTNEEWVKLNQRINEKNGWIKEKSGEIHSLFGDIYNGTHTDWGKMKESILEFQEMFHGIYMRKIKQYGFRIGMKKELKETFHKLEDAVEWTLLNENSMPLQEFTKQVGKALGYKRVTARLKEEMEQFIKNQLPKNYVIEEDKIVDKNLCKEGFQVAPEGEKREVQWITDEELLSGVERVICVEREIPMDDITKLFSKLLGYHRLSKSLQSRVEETVYELKRRHIIERKSAGWCLLSPDEKSRCRN